MTVEAVNICQHFKVCVHSLPRSLLMLLDPHVLYLTRSQQSRWAQNKSIYLSHTGPFPGKGVSCRLSCHPNNPAPSEWLALRDTYWCLLAELQKGQAPRNTEDSAVLQPSSHTLQVPLLGNYRRLAMEPLCLLNVC